MKILGIEGLSNQEITDHVSNDGKDVTREIMGALDIQALVS